MREDRGINGDAQRIEQMGWMMFLKIFDDKDQELEMLIDNYKSPIPKKYQWRNWAADSEGMTGDVLQKFVDNRLFPALSELTARDRRSLLVREVFEGNNNYMKSGTALRKVLNKLNEIDFNKASERHLFGEIYETILKELQSAGDSGEFYTPRAITQFMTEMINPQLGEIIYDPACGTGGFLTSAIEHLKKQVKNVRDRKILQENVRGTEYKPLPFQLALTNLILHDIEVPNLEYADSLSRQYNEIREKDRVDIILANPPFGGTVANGNEGNFPANFRTKESADLFLILILHLLKNGGRAAIVLPDGSLTGEGVKQRIRQRLLNECNLHTIVRLPNSVFEPYATVATNMLFFQKGSATKDIWYYAHRVPEELKSYSKTKPIKHSEFIPIKEWWTRRAESDYSWKVNIQTVIDNGYDLDVKNPRKTFKSKHAEMTHFTKILHSDLKDVFVTIKSIEMAAPDSHKVRVMRIGEICDVIKGKTGIKKAQPGRYPLVTTSDTRGSHNSYQFDCEAVCIPLVSSTGHGHASLKRVHYQNGKFALGTILAAVVSNDETVLSTKFLYYYLNHFKDELIVPLMKGMANVSLSVEKIKTISISLPTLKEQQKLVLLMELCKKLQDTLAKSSDTTEYLMRSALADAFLNSAKIAVD